MQRVKQEVRSFEQETNSPMRRKFMKLHGVSAVLNLVLIADGVALIVISPLLAK